MSFIKTKAKEINCKVVYVGPALAGKSTSLHGLYEETAPGHRGKLVTLSDKEHRTLFFDFLPLSLGKVKDYTLRFHVYTVPGQVTYDASRTLILKGVDGVIFVVDSQVQRLEENLESFRNLQTSLRNHDVDATTVPMVIQYNKRDLPDVIPVATLRETFNSRNVPDFETVATARKNIREAFQAVAKKVLLDLKKR